MNTMVRTTAWALLAASAIVLTGCSRATTIRSDLVLEPSGRARMQLHQKTQAIELLNDSEAQVRIIVLDSKNRPVSNMVLNARDSARLDLEPARALEFSNTSDKQAVIRWVLRNNDRIEFALEMSHANH